jgi:3-phenylpropionate/trans-cinnamate dioxygenase ferredoxin component
MEFVKVSSVEIEEGKMKSFKAKGKEVLIAKLESKHYALENKCTHMGCSLSDGTIKNGRIECPCHGSIFDIKTGKVLKGPASKSVAMFKVKVENDALLIDM